MKTGWAVAFSVVCTFLVAGALYLAASPPRGEEISLPAAPTPLPLVVQVSGAVARPGLYALPAGSRVQDAIDAAGGLTAEADLDLLNLAAFIQDGERVAVMARGAWQTPEAASSEDAGQAGISSRNPESPAPPDPQATPNTGPINLNTATQAELENLPGIGPSLAQRILAYREQHGPFTTIEDIQKVKGIGPKIYEKIKGLITIKP